MAMCDSATGHLLMDEICGQTPKSRRKEIGMIRKYCEFRQISPSNVSINASGWGEVSDLLLAIVEITE